MTNRHVAARLISLLTYSAALSGKPVPPQLMGKLTLALRPAWPCSPSLLPSATCVTFEPAAACLAYTVGNDA